MIKTSYKLIAQEQVLDGASGQYILRIRDMATDDKPREKLMRQGADTLTTPELLAIILSTGTKKEELMTMCDRIIKDYGERGILSETDAARLALDLDIPISKAIQVIACGELGKRFFQRNKMVDTVIRSADDVFAYVKDMRDLPKEHLRGIYLNSHYKVIHDEIISIGTVDANIIHPREVFKPAISHCAVALILVHNHPSGNPEPSENDITITKQIREAGELIGIPLIDHIVVSETCYKRII